MVEKMKKKNILFFTVLLLIIIVTIGVLSQEEESGLSDNIGSTDTLLVEQTQRSWSDVSLTPIPLDSDIQDSLFRPMILKIAGNYLYVGDYGDMKIKRFTPEGKFVNEIGIGRGKGPGEFTQFMDFYISKDTIHILDLRKMMVIQYNVNRNDYIQSFELDFRPLRIAGFKEKLIISKISGSKLFSIYDLNGKELNQFGEIIKNQTSNSLSLQGELISIDENEEFVFTPKYASYLIYYKLSGRVDKVVKTIDQRGFPSSQRRTSGGTRTVSAPETDMIIAGTFRGKNRLYLLYLKKNENTSDSEEGNLNAFIDIHNLESGEYQSSIVLPVPARNLVIKGELLYLIRDKDRRIVAFDIKKLISSINENHIPAPK